LSPKLFSDSKIAKKQNCGRTKAEAIVLDVLCPFSIENHIKLIISSNKKFAISSDASNRGNKKLFPLIVTYFTIENGITNFVLDFYEDPNEDSQSIFDHIKRILSKYNLPFENVVAFSGDNANVNFGSKNSVFTRLKNENSMIIKANCKAHIIHNAARYGLFDLPFDTESLIQKMHSHFSISAKRVQKLRSCFEI
jgi:hypothetical protein